MFGLRLPPLLCWLLSRLLHLLRLLRLLALRRTRLREWRRALLLPSISFPLLLLSLLSLLLGSLLNLMPLALRRLWLRLSLPLCSFLRLASGGIRSSGEPSCSSSLPRSAQSG